MYLYNRSLPLVPFSSSSFFPLCATLATTADDGLVNYSKWRHTEAQRATSRSPAHRLAPTYTQHDTHPGHDPPSAPLLLIASMIRFKVKGEGKAPFFKLTLTHAYNIHNPFKGALHTFISIRFKLDTVHLFGSIDWSVGGIS